MGRSVFTQREAVATVYLSLETGEDCTPEGWADFVEGVRMNIQGAFPSFDPESLWVDRESKAILANDLATVVISEYCGLVSLCLVPRFNSPAGEGLAVGWATRIAPRFISLFDRWGRLVKVGTMSNGEGVFYRFQPKGKEAGK